MCVLFYWKGAARKEEIGQYHMKLSNKYTYTYGLRWIIGVLIGKIRGDENWKKEYLS